MEEKVPLSIIYLGRRGGGAKITSQVSHDLKRSNHFSVSSICIRSDNELLKEYDQSSVVRLFDELRSVKTVLRIFQYAFMPKKLLTEVRLTSKGFCLIPMISPLGMVVEKILEMQGVTIIRLLHDFERHPGDNWPPNILNRHIVKKSKFLIALSNDVADKIAKLNPRMRVSVYPLPTFNFSFSDIEIHKSTGYLLFIGRIRRYKGVENLISAFTKLEIQDKELIIAGEGKLQVSSNSRIKTINRWLDETEITNLIKNAEVVIFPYLEASQSGILPYCVIQNKKVVVTPLVGLLDQVTWYENAYITQGFEVDDLVSALNAAIEATVVVRTTVSPVSKNIEACLLESGFFTKE